MATTGFASTLVKVNSFTKKDPYPLLYINVCNPRKATGAIYSSFILREQIYSTAFKVASRGLFQIIVMLFGMHSAPAAFQRLMDKIIGPDRDLYCFAYLDDIIVFVKTFDEYLTNLQEIFRRL